jgi:hypothetical protein
MPTTSPDNASAWLFRARLGTYDRGALVAAAFTIDGTAALAAGPGRLCRTRGFMWEELRLEGVSLDPARVRAIRAIGPDSFLLLGAGGLVAHVALDGTCAFWPLDPHAGAPIATAELTFYDALPEGDGAVLVGERPGATATVGVFARAQGHTVRIVIPGIPAARLRSIARAPSGALFAVGAGRIVVFERDQISASAELAPGELHGVAVVDDGALVVGAGAYAFSVTRTLRATLEEVQTTADLVALTATDGVGWAGSNRGARILRRSSAGVWTRMTGNLGSEAGVVALTVIEGDLRAILDDGTFITGALGI